eukprot:COSAG06_NODE_38609_length_421_cov_2.413043_1_plen_63_part_10
MTVLMQSGIILRSKGGRVDPEFCGAAGRRAAAGSVTRAAAASPRAGTQGIWRCAGCRRGRLQA